MLDRNHPGWQVYVIDGLARNRFAVFIKIHHSLVDGESGIALVHRSLSRSPQGPAHPHRDRDESACRRARAAPATCCRVSSTRS